MLPIALTLSALLGLAPLACDKSGSDADSTTPTERSNDPSTKDEGSQADAEVANLCTAYTSCNDCITGQIDKGKSEGEAETQCGLAVTGCWVTWDKPVVCGEKSYDEQPA